MGLIHQLLKTVVIWLFVLTVIILFVLIPRNVDYVQQGNDLKREYEFSFCEHRHNILLLFYNMWKDKSIGHNRFGESTTEDIQRYVPRSLKVIVTAFIISLPIGILKGLYDYRHIRSRFNFFGQGSTWFFQSMPDFFVLIMFQWIVILLIRAGYPQIPIYGYEDWYSFIIPSLLLSIYPILYMARITSSALGSQEQQQYLQTARAKGLTEKMIVYKHILGNCWTTILTHLSTIVLYMLSNLLMIEYLMYYQGAAYRLFQAMGFHIAYIGYNAETFEPYVIIAIAVCFMLLVFITQVISQVTRYMVDPRVREEGR